MLFRSNVSEWVSDWFDPDYYRKGINENPKGPAAGELKVFRGGSWNEDPEVARSAGRNGGEPTRKSYLTGFRCAKSQRQSAEQVLTTEVVAPSQPARDRPQ